LSWVVCVQDDDEVQMNREEIADREPAVDEMTDSELIDQFERAVLSPECFRHAVHVRVAFLYLAALPALEALQAFSRGLQRFAAVHGKSNLYHETITWAYIFLIRERMARTGTAQTWEKFASENQDLLIWKGGVLSRLYQQQTLTSDLARRVFVLPDKPGAQPS
jgi:hypothetical protein